MAGRSVGVHGDHAVRAVVAGDSVAVGGVRPTAAAASLADTLPPLRSGPGNPITVPADALVAPAPDHGSVFTNTSTGSVDRVRTLLGRPRLGVAQFFAAHRDELGARHRTRRTLSVLDTTDGRYAIRESVTDGATWYTVLPVDRDGLVRALAELAADVAA